ncbi:amidohydrolase family protein [uncultured Nocardioides sp.]|uniref:N-acetylglucosamine-6-phosphate deacetylase n=1 Tax=uncultured Nocardioides sp. TaxID=198441 RepID=UPI00262724EE|nr:amidohydrolase family protein [uncultured Nocardioides sp.]
MYDDEPMTGPKPDLLVRGGSRDVAIAGGLVAPTVPGDTPVLDASGLTVLPGVIDLQVNGVAGIDLTAEPARLWEAGAALASYGVTAWLPTVITSDPDARDLALETYAAGPPAGWRGSAPLGLHFEGPFIAPARKGAHPEQWLRLPSPELVEGWSRDAGVLMATVAPELPGAIELVRELVGRGVRVAIGHTDATADDVVAAVDAGATSLTHLGNAMPPMLAREPGPVGVALGGTRPDVTRLVAGVIVDGHHLHPDVVTAMWRALGPSRFLTVSDTTAGLGLPEGRARLGDQEVVVSAGTVRLVDGTLAGSAAGVMDCLRLLHATTGCSLEEAVATVTTTPADLVGDPTRGRLEPGLRGDLTLVDADLQPVVTVVGGRVVHDRRGREEVC